MRIGPAVRSCTALLVLASVGCSDPPPRAPARREPTAQWQDVFEGVPDIYAVIRPRALKRDDVYGSFWRSLVRVAEARHYVSGATMLEAIEGAEEIIVGLGKGSDAALVLRGVPASLDPGRLVDVDGRPWFRPLDERTRVVEYEVVQPSFAGHGALFVLPDRTWVAALGAASQRGRAAFATPTYRPVPRVEPDALAALHFGAPVAGLLRNHRLYGAVVDRVSNVTFTLKPGKGGLVVALAYDEAGAVAKGEMQARQVVERFASNEKEYGWLRSTRVHAEGNTVLVELAIPPRLLEELPNASGADFGF